MTPKGRSTDLCEQKPVDRWRSHSFLSANTTDRSPLIVVQLHLRDSNLVANMDSIIQVAGESSFRAFYSGFSVPISWPQAYSTAQSARVPSKFWILPYSANTRICWASFESGWAYKAYRFSPSKGINHLSIRAQSKFESDIQTSPQDTLSVPRRTWAATERWSTTYALPRWFHHSLTIELSSNVIALDFKSARRGSTTTRQWTWISGGLSTSSFCLFSKSLVRRLQQSSFFQ